MKLLTKLPVITLAFAVLGSSAAFADDQRLQQRLFWEQAQDSASRQPTTTIALYSSQRRGGSVATQNDKSPGRFHLRSNHHGQVRGDYRAE